MTLHPVHAEWHSTASEAEMAFLDVVVVIFLFCAGEPTVPGNHPPMSHFFCGLQRVQRHVPVSLCLYRSLKAGPVDANGDWTQVAAPLI